MRRLHKNTVAAIMAVVLFIVLILNFRQAEQAATWLHPGLLAVLQTLAFLLMYVSTAFGEFADLPPGRPAWLVRAALAVMALIVFGWLAVQNILVTFSRAAIPADIHQLLQDFTGMSALGVRFTWAAIDASVRVGLEALASIVLAVLLWMPDPIVSPVTLSQQAPAPAKKGSAASAAANFQQAAQGDLVPTAAELAARPPTASADGRGSHVAAPE